MLFWRWRTTLFVPFPRVDGSVYPFISPFLITIIRLKIFLFAEKVSNITCVSGFIGGAIATTVESADALRAGKAIGVYRLPTKG
ncbi:hypothetical protein OAE34_02200 [Akkermansiaceae bacterium]|nr:hypothetical protein [Akkermansiaceae bacterium]MDB4723507.1 hypothetical protein [Akkermansiaceae bacterium]